MRFFLLIFAIFSLAATPGDARIDIEAAQLEVHQTRGEARFSGGVTVRQESFTLRCTTLVAHYDQGGRVNALDARGEVRVEADGWSATATNARYERATETLSLEGQPTLTRGKDTLRGARIVFWIAEKRMVVDKVRGRIEAPRLSDIAPGRP